MTTSISRFRWQFNLRWLFYATFATGVCAYLATNNGPAEAIGVGVAFALAGLFFALPSFEYQSVVRRLIGLSAALTVWGVAVDRSVYWVGCEHCQSHWNEARYRVFGCPIATWKGSDHSPTLRNVAEDLGAPCPHEYGTRMLIRQWGIVFYLHPRICEICCLGGDDWYTDEVRPRGRELGQRRPDLGRRLQAALIDHNHVAIRAVVAEVHQSVTAGSDP